METSTTFKGAGSMNPQRAPRVAETIADELRRQITEGDLPDGALLPRQEDLIAKFGVSRPSVREALGILEAEGLISVRRGNRGGAIVHRPQVDNVAYMVGLVLKSNEVPVEEVGNALNLLEPLCASLCAQRQDRLEAVLPRLRAIHEESKNYIDDPVRFAPVYRKFHEEIVACSGNQAIILLIGALERVYSAHALLWAEAVSSGDADPDRDYRQGRQRAIDDHELFMRLIERGDAEAAEREVRAHLLWTPIYATTGEERVVPLLHAWSEEE